MTDRETGRHKIIFLKDIPVTVLAISNSCEYVYVSVRGVADKSLAAIICSSLHFKRLFINIVEKPNDEFSRTEATWSVRYLLHKRY